VHLRSYNMYKLTNYNRVLKYNDDGSIASIPFDPDNTDYQTYLKWLEEGNEPLPADE
jgi:hypothetical protein